VVGILKNIIFGNAGAKITKRQSSPLVASIAPQNDPNRDREILRRKAIIAHNSKTN